MNGPQHYAEAERLLADVAVASANGLHGLTGEFTAVPSWAPVYIEAAKVHAALAHVAAVAMSQPIYDGEDTQPGGYTGRLYHQWQNVAGSS